MAKKAKSTVDSKATAAPNESAADQGASTPDLNSNNSSGENPNLENATAAGSGEVPNQTPSGDAPNVGDNTDAEDVDDNTDADAENETEGEGEEKPKKPKKLKGIDLYLETLKKDGKVTIKSDEDQKLAEAVAADKRFKGGVFFTYTGGGQAIAKLR